MDLKSVSKNFPGFSRIFSVHDPLGNRPFRAYVGITSEECTSFLHGEAYPDAPIQPRWHMGSPKPMDVIWTTMAAPLLISKRLVGILREHKFTGWDVSPVDLRGKTGEALPDYYFLHILGRCGPIDDSKSKNVGVSQGGGFNVLRGLYFDPAAWDGSDFFMADNANFIFVSEDVKKVIQKEKIRNLRFDALDEIERDR